MHGPRSRSSKRSSAWPPGEDDAELNVAERPSLPVIVGFADYTEYYGISAAQYQEFVDSPASAVPFADQCRRREHDDLLMMPPPATNRGTALEDG